MHQQKCLSGFPAGSAAKESSCTAGDLDLIPGLRRSPGEGKGYPLQYSSQENSMDCIVHKVAKSQTWLSDSDSLRHQLPLQARLVFTGKEYTSKSGKNLLVKNESGLFPSNYSLRPLFLKVSLSKFPLKYLEKNWKWK